jgi:hypothetical protein
MGPSSSSSDSGLRGVRDAGGDAFQLTIDYLKQETLGPLKGIVRFLAWGLAGSLAIGVGVLLLLVGVLRLLQEETGSLLTGDWSWVPYFVVTALGLMVAGVAAWRITAGPGRRKLPQKGPSIAPAPSATPSATPSAATPTSVTPISTAEGSS